VEQIGMKTVTKIVAVLFFVWLVMQSVQAAESSSVKWEKDIQAFEAADKKSPPPEGAVLFIGASTIRLWKTLDKDFPDQKVINRGFGGSEIADSTYFADRIVVPYKPRLILLRAGGNDINAGKSPEQVAADFKAFVETVQAKLPETRIAFMSNGPSPARWSQADKQRQANQLIKDFIATQKNLVYIEMFDCMLGDDKKPREELYVKDRLHNSSEGYKVWTAIIAPYLK
jgi:lysophospholipase L1-like esterase